MIDLGGVDVEADDVVADLGQAGRRDEPDIPRTLMFMSLLAEAGPRKKGRPKAPFCWRLGASSRQ